MDFKTKLRMAEAYAGINQTVLCERMNVSNSAFSQRLSTCKFSPDDLAVIGEALGANVEITIEFPNGTRF